MWRKGNPHALLVGMWIDAAIMESSMKVPQKTINRINILSSNSASKYLFKKFKSSNSKSYMHPMVTGALFIKSQDMETT